MAGCGAAGAPGAVGADAAASANGGLGRNGPSKLNGPSGPNGPFGRGGPFEGRAATAALANSPGGKAGVTVQVSGSTALEATHKMPWLFALGYGISASAPLSVRPGTDTPADAAAGFYDAFYEQRFAAACRYVVPARQASCPVLLGESSGSADALYSPAIGFVVAKGDQALVTMTGVLCRTAAGCVGQHNPDWIFGMSYPFDMLWSATARDGGNPLTVTPFTRAAGRWYLNLPARIP
jgi:hypothetical protein